MIFNVNNYTARLVIVLCGYIFILLSMVAFWQGRELLSHALVILCVGLAALVARSTDKIK